MPTHHVTGTSDGASSVAIATSDVPPSIEAVRRLLSAALDADPAAFEGDRFAVAEALAVLEDVTPPYPPLPPQVDADDLRDVRRRALQLLETALDEVTAVRDLTRLGLAAIVLRRGGGVLA